MNVFHDFDAPTQVSTPTILLPFTRITASSILFCVCNLDPTNPVTMMVETAEHIAFPSSDYEQKVCPALQSNSIEIGPGQSRSFWRLSAFTAGPGYPAASVIWCVKIRP